MSYFEFVKKWSPAISSSSLHFRCLDNFRPHCQHQVNSLLAKIAPVRTELVRRLLKIQASRIKSDFTCFHTSLQTDQVPFFILSGMSMTSAFIGADGCSEISRCWTSCQKSANYCRDGWIPSYQILSDMKKYYEIIFFNELHVSAIVRCTGIGETAFWSVPICKH